MSRLIAIDPGDKHVGVAFFTGQGCYLVQEMTPDELCDLMWVWMDTASVDTLVVEKFQLYPDKAKEQSYGEMLTSQLIGRIKEIVRRTMTTTGLIVPIIEQPASIKQPTFKQLRARKIQSIAKRDKVPGQHVLDAEAHGWYYLMKGAKQQGVAK